MNIIENIKLLIPIFYNENKKLISELNWHEWNNYIKINSNPYYLQFYNLFLQLDNIELLKLFKHFKKHPPIIIYTHVKNKFIKFYHKQYNEKISKIDNTNINLIAHLLSYFIISEIPIDNYVVRLDNHLGW